MNDEQARVDLAKRLEIEADCETPPTSGWWNGQLEVLLREAASTLRTSTEGESGIGTCDNEDCQRVTVLSRRGLCPGCELARDESSTAGGATCKECGRKEPDPHSRRCSQFVSPWDGCVERDGIVVEPAQSEGAGEARGHRVKLEFAGGITSITLIHDADCFKDQPLYCSECGGDFTCIDGQIRCKCGDNGPCLLTSWVENCGDELVEGSVTVPVEIEWTVDGPQLFLRPAPPSPTEQEEAPS